MKLFANVCVVGAFRGREIAGRLRDRVSRKKQQNLYLYSATKTKMHKQIHNCIIRIDGREQKQEKYNKDILTATIITK